DFDQFVKVLRAAGVIDEKHDWTGGKTHLVQTGDVLDRGPDSRKAMDLLMKLEAQAAKAGGAVHPLIGNHEAMVLLGDWRYLTREEIESFGGEDGLREAMSPAGKYGKWIRSHNAVVKVNDLLFVHGGVRPAFARMSLKEINDAIREELAKGGDRGIAMDPAGPLWDRTYAIGDEDDVAEELGEVLKRYGARRMVIGHTVKRDGVVTRAGGRVVRIDVGMCAAYGGPAACLVVEKGVLYEVRHPDKKRKLTSGAHVEEPYARAPADRRLSSLLQRCSSSAASSRF
ncbi:MAG TPA: metallophosphoesterase, partial [Planctomycetota bacterium]|nr:metallophosphoesterase [Planctomycetota bacterium]